ncbi:MAG TPA: fumarylacetoacetate hydrolase family protein, partial [Dehalococcoidia bacterium]|nr:fumarylacetoacetate hydrolase family protein [Dehalococcoidia bacterium]
MKLVTYEIATPLGRFARLGALSDAGLVDLNFAQLGRLTDRGVAAADRLALATVPPEMVAFLDGGTESRDAAEEALGFVRKMRYPAGAAVGPRGEVVVHDPASIKILAPLPRPRSLRDFLTFEQHAGRSWRERGESLPKQWYEMPIYYKGSHHAILGPDEDLIWPAYTEKLDYELELGCVLGGTGRNLSPDEAERVIFGYTVLNDFSAR